MCDCSVLSDLPHHLLLCCSYWHMSVTAWRLVLCNPVLTVKDSCVSSKTRHSSVWIFLSLWFGEGAILKDTIALVISQSGQSACTQPRNPRGNAGPFQITWRISTFCKCSIRCLQLQGHLYFQQSTVSTPFLTLPITCKRCSNWWCMYCIHWCIKDDDIPSNLLKLELHWEVLLLINELLTFVSYLFGVLMAMLGYYWWVDWESWWVN